MADPSVLEQVIAHLERTGLAAEVTDRQWRLAWVSPQLRVLLGEDDDEALGLGEHWLVTRQLPAWDRAVQLASPYQTTRAFAGYMAVDMPGGLEEVLRLASEGRREALRTVEPVEGPPLFTWDLDYLQEDLPPAPATALAIRVREPDGALVCTVFVYAPHLPASLQAMLTRGDERMFERMAALREPGRRSAAVLFADLEASGALSRRLPSAAYFRLVQAIATGFDAAVAEQGGIVGKHAGDGVTAFFLAEQLGSEAAAVRAALETARASSEVSAEATAALAHEGGGVGQRECRLNIGLHWGGGLYMGQVVTDGRLEVTALGDEVNECARIEQSARGGEILASKPLVERLDPEDARELRLDPDATAYRMLAELDGASAKAARDAGTLPVADLRGALLGAPAG